MPGMRSLRVGTAPGGSSTSSRLAQHPSQLFEKRSVNVYLSPRAFGGFWVAIILTHCVCAAFPAAVGMLYRYLLTTNFMDNITSNALSVEKRYYPSISTVYFGFSFIHCAMLAMYVARSLRCRKLVFRMPVASATTPPPDFRKGLPTMAQALLTRLNVEILLAQAKRVVVRALQQLQLWVPHLVLCFFKAIWNAGKVCLAAMDIRSENYGILFLVREIVQTFLQSYQAFRVSLFVPRLWMNNVMVGFLVLNCWSTPLIQFFSHSTSIGHTRLCCAIVSVLLDIVTYIAIPLTLFIPYYEQFNRQTKTYDVQYGYMDVWLIQMINELQILLVQTLYDGLSKCLIAMSVARWLYAMTKIICPAESLASTRASIVPEPVDAKASGVIPDAAPPSPVKGKFRSGTVSNMLPRISARKHQIEKAGHRFLVLWGLFILIVHLHAASHPLYPQCQLRTRPWFTSKPGCSLLEVNCVEEKMVGAASDIERIIRTVQADHIEHLVLRRCTALEIPTYLNSLSNLLGLKIYNSSILKWNEDAAITSSRHPLLRFMFFIDVNATELPPGLLSPEFPQKLSQVVISKSNLTEIPENLDTIWPKRLILVLEEMQLQAFPDVVPRMLPLYLSLALNNLTAIPEALFDTNFIPLLILSGNPIESLPANVWRFPFLGWLGLASTKISDFPVWIEMARHTVLLITAANTPLCDRMVADGEATTALGSRLVGGVDCSLTTTGPGPVNWYPIAFEDARNPSYTLK